MTPQESKLLQEFLAQLVDAGGVPKDRDADEQIQRAARAQPDALYLLVQRSLILGQALEAAQQRIADLERAASAASGGARTGGSFLDGGGWGRSGRSSGSDRDGSLAGEAAAFQGARGGQGAGGSRLPMAGALPGSSARAGGGRAGSLLGQAAAVAAGVAGGAFLFQGLGSLLGQHGGTDSGFLSPGGLSPASDAVAFNDSAAADTSFADSGSQGLAQGDQGADLAGDSGPDVGGEFDGGGLDGGDFGDDGMF